LVYNLSSSLEETPFLQTSVRTGKLRIVIEFDVNSTVDLALLVYLEQPAKISFDKKYKTHINISVFKTNISIFSCSMKVTMDQMVS
jgi:hypothetical protein